jgi:hypothetical protein
MTDSQPTDRHAFTRLVQTAADGQLRELSAELLWKLSQVQGELAERARKEREKNG